ncbi:MAG: glycosyltransferase family 4 protein [Acidobacteria bacterium]|nr:glycosyltransferase family 4 protein [Acidobacteriota bacterium]MBI3655108.1 glycosyltransferase family 4 protein [Acidobacteriota bacterium]
MKILLLNQAFYPDVASSGQHLTDLALHLVARRHQVTVLTGARAYDDPVQEYPKRERWQGIDIIRISCFGFGKAARWRRALDFASFLLNCALCLLWLPRFDLVVAMTSPPLISCLAALFVKLKGGRFLFWIMDLNPDEAIAAGWLRPRAPVTQFLNGLLMFSLSQAAKIIVLDRFMKTRILAKGIAESKVTVIPPWSHDEAVCYDPDGRRAFRAAHGLMEKYVVMYSGNHSPCHPLDTLLQAAWQMADDTRVHFCFVGGGSAFAKVKAFAMVHHLRNVVCLPYQPLDRLSASLSAADRHVVVMGDPFVGIIHPCKIYNILAIGGAFLYIGPRESHIGDILDQTDNRAAAAVARHGEVDTVVRQIKAAADKGLRSGNPGKLAIAAHFSKRVLLPQLTDTLESVCGQWQGLKAGAAQSQTSSSKVLKFDL